jgi:hypothetical protein
MLLVFLGGVFLIVLGAALRTIEGSESDDNNAPIRDAEARRAWTPQPRAKHWEPAFL